MMPPVFVRLGYFMYVLIGISMVSFGLSALAPGDPAEILLRIHHEAPTPDQVAAFRNELGLDAPLWIRYLRWLKCALKGDFGRSWQNGEPVLGELAARLPATVELAMAAFGFILVFSTIFGSVSALCRDGLTDHAGRILSILAMSIPAYWLGFLLIYGFAIRLGWLPVMGRGGIAHLLLPAITLGLAATAMQGRLLRAGLIEVMSQDHVRFAVAKGLKRRTVLMRHVLKNAIGPAAILWGISLGTLLAGAPVVETVFSWPGLGRLMVEAILSRDIPMLQGCVPIAATAVAAANWSAETFQKWLNPRLHEGRR